MTQEDPPTAFHIEYLWKASSAAFNRRDLFNTILYDTAAMALQSWDCPIAAAQFPTPFQIEIGFVSNRATLGMKVKSVIWALDKMFDNFVDQQHYAPGNVLVSIGSVRIGVGSVRRIPSPSEVSISTERFSISTPERPGATSSLSMTEPPLEDESALLLDPQNNLSTIPPNSTTSALTSLSILTGKHITAKVKYRPGGQSFPDVQIFKSSLQLLAQAAEPQDSDISIGTLLSTYNSAANLTFSFAPNRFVKYNELSWADVINTISSVITAMSQVGAQGTWAEMGGTIMDGNEVIGRCCIDKGDSTQTIPDEVCNQELANGITVS